MGSSKPVTSGRSSSSSSGELVVLVTAHPDDESLFFVPTLNYWVSFCGGASNNTTVWLLCLTTGNYDGLGSVRARELRDAADNILRVDRTILLDNPQFQDGPSEPWDVEVVATAIQKALAAALGTETTSLLQDLKTLRLITFDRDGVSGHSNHRDTFRAVRSLLLPKNKMMMLQQSCLPASSAIQDIQVWALETIHNPIVKYLPLSEWMRLVLCWWGLASSAAPASTPNVVTYRLLQPSLNWKVMAAHRSQFVWYRRLFVVFSCYTYVNRLRWVEMKDDDDETTALLPANDSNLKEE